jgi:hypothetical protein
MDERPAWRDALVSAIVYLEGGGDSRELHRRCCEGFRKLLENCGFKGRMPHLVACGGREGAMDDFKTAHSQRMADYVALLIDSEKPLASVNAGWAHFKREKPAGAGDDQVLFMTTCMETWIVADRNALAAHYGAALQTSALPPLDNLELRGRDDIQAKLARATRKCTNAYEKGKRSFAVLAKLKPDTLQEHLPSFARAREILNKKL